MSLQNFRYWTPSKETIPAESNGRFCMLPFADFKG
jgi:hypothetical protein